MTIKDRNMGVCDLVQGVLLDSEGDPCDEVREALLAVVEFAFLETDMSSHELQALFGEVLQEQGA